MSITLFRDRILARLSDVRAGLKFPRNFAMLLLQVLGALAVLDGISWFSIPCALIVGGVGAIVAIEMQTHSVTDDASEDALIKAKIDNALKLAKNPFDEPGVPTTMKWLSYVNLVLKRPAS